LFAAILDHGTALLGQQLGLSVGDMQRWFDAYDEVIGDAPGVSWADLRAVRRAVNEERRAGAL
jgi:hypothetical protein